MSNYNGNLKSHVTSDKIKWIVTFVAFVLVAVLFAGIFAGWFKVPAPKEETPAEGGGVDGGAVLTPGDDVVDEDGNRLSLTAYEIPRAEYEEYGIMPIAQTAYTLTATVNGDATVKAVDWTVEFKNPASEWATGKTVTEYVTVSSTGELTAIVQCLKAFGEQILVSAVSKDNPAAKATCTCDYEMRVLGVNFRARNDTTSEHSLTVDRAVTGSNLGKIYFFDTYYFANISAHYSDGTVNPAPKFTFERMTWSISDKARVELAKNGYVMSGSSNGYEIRNSDPSGELGDEALFAVFGSEVLTQRNNLFTALKALNALSGMREFKNIIEVNIHFVPIGAGSYEGPTDFKFYLDVDADSVYTPVSSVQLDQSNLLF